MRNNNQFCKLNELPVEIHQMILGYLSMSDLGHYASMSKYNLSLIIDLLRHRCEVTSENVRKRITNKQEPFEALLAEKPSTRFYHYYIDHGDLLILIQEVGFEKSKKLLWNMLGYLNVAKKIAKDYALMEMLLKEAPTYVKEMMAIFPQLISDILENEKIRELFRQTQDSKAYLSDLASQSPQAAIDILSKKNIIEHLLSYSANQILDPSEYLHDIPEALLKENDSDYENDLGYDSDYENDLGYFDRLYSEAEEDMNHFNPGTPLPASIDQYLQAIITKCRQLLANKDITSNTNDYMQKSLCL